MISSPYGLVAAIIAVSLFGGPLFWPFLALVPFTGASLFVLSSITGEKIERITAAMWPFVIAEIAVLFLVAYWPGLTLSVPALLGL